MIDEACSSIRVQLDSQPEAIDVLQRKLLQLEIEATALGNEKDKASSQRLLKVNEEISKLKEDLTPLMAQYKNEKGRMDEVRDLNNKLDALKVKMKDAERRHDLALAADLRYGAIPDVERRIQVVEAQVKAERDAMDLDNAEEKRLLQDIVGPEKIMEIVSRATGIPLQRLSKSQSERLLGLSDVLHKRIVGQGMYQSLNHQMKRLRLFLMQFSDLGLLCQTLINLSAPFSSSAVLEPVRANWRKHLLKSSLMMKNQWYALI